MRDLLGGKGANLAEMSALGLPVPPGFTITTEACHHFYKNNRQWPEGLEDGLKEALRFLEEAMGCQLGDSANPLLLSVRSGAAVSMPGMMDTVLNIGLNDVTVEAMAAKTGHDRFAWDSYRRLIDMFGDVAIGIPHERFEEKIEAIKRECKVEFDTDLTTGDLKLLVDRYKAIYRKETGYMFPQDPMEQLRFAINAVFESWHSARAVRYREINRIDNLLGTAVTVQCMVFGNMGKTSGSGVLFTRDPTNGANRLYGEFLIDSQGEDVVAGIRTPEPVRNMRKKLPQAHSELLVLTQKLEQHYKDMLDVEFTVQEGTLHLLQTRSGKRTGPAAVKIALDMVGEGLVSKEEAVLRLVTTDQLAQLLHPRFSDFNEKTNPRLGTGLPASPGGAVGKVFFSSTDAEAARKNGDPVILARIETSPEDVGGMDAAEGILTSRGGMTSHAAVVARGWGKPCVVGCDDIIINYSLRSFTNGETTVHEGDWISINGTTGEVFAGEIPLQPAEMSGDFTRFMGWTDEFRTMGVRTNADRPEDAAKAVEFGAEGIGLCRTEHMFFQNGRIAAVRRMILAKGETERKEALLELLPFQKEDFKGIFRAMPGRPVTIRLLDPPLHEFLPREPEEIDELARQLKLPANQVKSSINRLAETNPMLGHRGCRIGITYPEITGMQTRAILEAAVEVLSEGVPVLPEIMVPLVGTGEELKDQKEVIESVAKKVFTETGAKVDYKIGTMIEVPRAALLADEIAPHAQFFSFGTNDLTQMTFGFSRDDAGKFLPDYLRRGILSRDPFQSLDTKGVGRLLREAVTLGRKVNSDLKIGICGEHGGDPDSIAFCQELGLTYVSCSPFRVPVARLAAAQAHLRRCA